MRAEDYIKDLLYRYNCVVMPEFGGFLAQSKSAQLDAATNTIYPPSKTISFNEQLAKNDGLLVSHIAKDKDLPYEEMLQEVLLISRDWKKKLKAGGTLELFGVGTLRLNETGRIVFNPENKINYLTSSFGLSSFVATPVKREVLKEEVEELEEKIPFIITPEKREATGLRPYLKYAAILLLALSTGFTGYQLYNQSAQKQTLARQNAQEQVSKYIQEATFFDSAPLELPSLSLNVKKVDKTKKTHSVIAGAFRVRANADKTIGRLQNKGYNAFYLGTNRYGLHQVAYDSFEDPKEALTFLKQIRRTESPDAWLLSEK
ncbi:SPOR domain-containing protein [Allomuricauda sp. d1]|uniref:HU domain-containing protein n=1 Tax=Allomuricauda sp. d1 TaxID=3136725 RepID=UPI0031E338D6